MTDHTTASDIEDPGMPRWITVLADQPPYRRESVEDWAIPHDFMRRGSHSGSDHARIVLYRAFRGEVIDEEALRERAANAAIDYGHHVGATAANAINDIGTTLLAGHTAAVHVANQFRASNDAYDDLYDRVDAIVAAIWPGDAATTPPDDEVLREALAVHKRTATLPTPPGPNHLRRLLKLAMCNQRGGTNDRFAVNLHHLMRDLGRVHEHRLNEQLHTALTTVLAAQ